LIRCANIQLRSTARRRDQLRSIAGPAVLKFGPAETFVASGAMSPGHTGLCRLRRLAWPAHSREKPGFSTSPGQFPLRDGLSAGGDWIRTSSTRAREVGDRAPTAAKSNGSTKPLSMRIGDLRSARTPHQGPGGQGHRRARPLGRGPHRGRRFIARDRARYRYYEGSRSDPAVTACQHYFKNCGFSRDVMRQSSRAGLRQNSLRRE
jgi:hypothetical protein